MQTDLEYLDAIHKFFHTYIQLGCYIFISLFRSLVSMSLDQGDDLSLFQKLIIEDSAKQKISYLYRILITQLWKSNLPDLIVFVECVYEQ